jgi:hypothetical protein
MIVIIIIIIISLFMPTYSVFAHVNQLDLTRRECQTRIPGLAAIASRRGKSAEITNVNNDE